MRILIADDEDIFRSYLRRAVEWDRFGEFEFFEAPDGKSALTVAEKVPLDMVLADIEMPLMDGLTCAAGIKELRPDSEIILISGHDKFSYAQTALKIGISDFLVKPVSAQTLETALEPAILRIQERQKTRLDQYHVTGMLAAESYAREKGYITYCAQGGAEQQMGYPHEMRARLAKALNEGDREQIGSLLREYVADMEENQVPLDCMSSLSLGLVTLCLEELKRMNIPQDQVFQADFTPYVQLSRLENPQMILEWLMNVYARTLEGMQQKHSIRVQRLVREARRRMDEQYPDPDFGIAELAKSMYVNEGYIRKLFKQTGNGTPSTYLRDVRMRTALVLIRDEGKSVLEAAAAVGFRDPSYFSKCFKQYHGCAPSYYERARMP